MVLGSCASTAGFDRCSSATGLRRFSRFQRGRIGGNVGNGDEFLAKIIQTRCCRSMPMMPYFGALSPMVRADRAALRDYFVTAFRGLPGLKVTCFGLRVVY